MKNKIDYHKALNVMILAAKNAGKLLLHDQKKLSQLKVTHKEAQGVVSEADLASEKTIIHILSKSFPQVVFLAEESSYINHQDPFSAESQSAEWTWIIDPLDGTTNFLGGMDYYAICISLVHKGKPVIGLVFRPKMDECFIAIKNEGTYKRSLYGRGKKVKIDPWRNSKKLKECLLVTGFATEKGEVFENEFDQFKKLMGKSRGVRRMGSAALDLCYVAEGIFDAFWERGLAPWDVSAAGLICQEAGVKVTDYHAQAFNPFAETILAARMPLYKELQSHFE